MSNSRIKNLETGRVVQTGSQTKNVAYIRCSPRFLAIVQGISQACDMPMMVPLQGAEIPPLPAWAGKICEQLSKTIFKRQLELRPKEIRSIGATWGKCWASGNASLQFW